VFWFGPGVPGEKWFATADSTGPVAARAREGKVGARARESNSRTTSVSPASPLPPLIMEQPNAELEPLSLM